MKYSFHPLGDRALLIQYEDVISEHLNENLLKASITIREADIPGVQEIVPAYQTVTIFYNPLKISYEPLKQRVNELLKREVAFEVTDASTIEIPVLYGGEFGEDLEAIATHSNLTVDEVIKKHTSPTYHVYMLGFLPGFPYMGGLDKTIAKPRLKKPRQVTKKGSIGIANEQTGVYPVDSPGGWNIIGRTPLEIFRTNKPNPFLIKPGNKVIFTSIDEKTYYMIENEQLNNEM